MEIYMRAEPSNEVYYRIKTPIVHWKVANYYLRGANILANLKHKAKKLFGMKSEPPVALKYHPDPDKTPGSPTHVPLGPPGTPTYGSWKVTNWEGIKNLKQQGHEIEYGDYWKYKAEQEKLAKEEENKPLLPDYETAKKQAAAMKSDPEAEKAIVQGWVERVKHNKAMDDQIRQIKKEPRAPTN